MEDIFAFERYLEQAQSWAEIHYRSSSIFHKTAFANSVAYLTTGFANGCSLREHLVSWSLAGRGAIEAVAWGDEAITAISPDGTLPRAGDWTFEAACSFAAPLCFNPASMYRDALLRILEREHCYDDDPEDLEALQK